MNPEKSYPRFTHFLATGFYSGLSPIMPGTAGSVAAAILAIIIFSLAPPSVHIPIAALLAVVAFFLGVLLCNRLLLSGKYETDSDPQEIVIDEFAGYFISIVGLTASPTEMLVALVCFRLFDITKPPPVGAVEAAPRGWGIMLDDVVAGIYAALVARAWISLW